MTILMVGLILMSLTVIAIITITTTNAATNNEKEINETNKRGNGMKIVYDEKKKNVKVTADRYELREIARIVKCSGILVRQITKTPKKRK